MSLPSRLAFPAFDTDRHRIGRSLTIRGLGLIYLIAIASWWTQAVLLVGENGLLPAATFLDWVRGQIGETRSPLLVVPTLFWLTGASDFAIHATCFAGCLLALLAIIGRFTGPALLLLWTIYLSLVNTGGVFMSFQWDILLLEAGFLALFLADWKRKIGWINPPPLGRVNRIALVGFWFLIAKLMFFSGWVKLAWAGEVSPEWWPDGSAMSYHYMTQPLPTWTAWWAHQLPAWFQRASLIPMYLVELVLPFAILLGRWGRLVAAIGFAGLMLLILATGNYTYFNWLAIVLCFPLVNDRLWPQWLRSWLAFQPIGLVPRPVLAKRLPPVLAASVPLGLVALVNLRTVLSDLHEAPRPLLASDLTPQWLDDLAATVGPFHLASGYGLFRTMTTERPEIILEGSSDGVTWLPYDFHWKVDEIDSRPCFVAPHQPRVAWQFWFAALEGRFDYRSRNAPWIEKLVMKLLDGDRSVERLLRRNPFPDTPPQRIRARLMRYEFTSMAERQATGDWWKRVVIGDYLPEVGKTAVLKEE